MPYARPVRTETMMSWRGSEICNPATWATQNTIEDTNRHQNRDTWSFLTRRSDPIPARAKTNIHLCSPEVGGYAVKDLPLRRRPVKLRIERQDTCITCCF